MRWRRAVRNLLVPRGRERDESGAVAVMVGLLTVVLVGVCSLAIDIGYQRVAKRDMQAIADIVSMDMARKLDGKTTGQLSGSTWNDALADSLNRNDNSSVGEPLTVIPCTADDHAVFGNQICATPGIYVDGVFSGSGSKPATHVRVIARTTIDYFFPIFADGGASQATAYSEASDQTCLRVSSYVADANLNDGALGPLLNLLGTKVGLTAAQGTSLADVDISLLSLINAEVDGVTLGQAVDTKVSLAGLFDVIGTDVLTQEQTAALQVLEFLEPKVGGMQVALSDLVALGTGSGSGLDTKVNLFDIVGASIVAANGENGLALDLPVALPSSLTTLGVTAKAHVIQKPQTACGSRRAGTNNPIAETSQVGLSLHANLDLSGGALGTLLNTVTDLLTGLLTLGFVDARLVANASLDIDLKLVPARAQLKDVTCDGDSRTVYFRVTGGDLLEVNVTANANVAIEQRTRPTWGSPWGPWSDAVSVRGPLKVSTVPNGPTWTDHEITLSNDGDYDLPQLYGSKSIGVPPVGNLVTSGLVVNLGGLALNLGSVVSAVVSPVTALLSTILSTLDNGVLNPILKTLGIDVSGARVSALRVPSCGYPALRG